MDQFKDTYITEANELLEDMEERLLNLDHEDVDLEEINAIFRCAHSIKGGGGSFGFTRLVAFTHILEFLLDAVRNEEIETSEDIVDALLRSVDVVSALVSAAQNGEELEEGHESELAEELKALSEGKVGASSAPAQEPSPVPTEAGGGNEEEAFGLFDEDDAGDSSSQLPVNTFQIKFEPFQEVFVNGNEPLFIIRELGKIADIEVTPNLDKIPNLKDLDPLDCYVSWDIKAVTECSEIEIREVFEFVEDECKLEVELISSQATSSSAPAEDMDEDGAFGLFIDEPEVSNNESSDDPDGAFGLFIDDDVSNSQTPKVEEKPVEPKKVVKPTPAKSADQKPAKQAAVSSIRVDIDKIDRMVNMVGELVITQAMIMQRIQNIPAQYLEDVTAGVTELSRHTRDMQEAVMSVRMQPVKSVFSRMPRIVRDLSKKLNKKVRIETFGEATEIDKTVIEQLSDPLTHMIRNSVDHGIEMPDVRASNGKSEEGVIKLSADSSGGRIIIEIADDGGGVNREKVLEKAIEKGVVAEDANLSNEEIDQLIFAAGFSTADAVTDVSGRGVGMDVVRKNIKNLGGDIDMTNVPGQGSTFQISLPLTLAILDGMVIRLGQEKYIIPINNILETMQIPVDELMDVKKGDEVVNVRGEFIPIVYLSRVFSEKSDNESDRLLVVLVETGRHKIGVVVDDLIGQQQVVIKNLEENSDPVEGISGATILGDGNVSLILDIAQIQKMRFKTKSKANDNNKTSGEDDSNKDVA